MKSGVCVDVLLSPTPFVKKEIVFDYLFAMALEAFQAITKEVS